MQVKLFTDFYHIIKFVLLLALLNNWKKNEVMSHLIVIAAEMHKIAYLNINVKYRQPGNLVEYIPVEFEVFRDGEIYRAIPLQSIETRILTTLPDELTFEITEDKILNHIPGKEEVVEDIVSKLVEMNVVERPQT